MIVVTNPLKYKPIATQFLILGTLKKLYLKEFNCQLDLSKDRKDMFGKVLGTHQAWKILTSKGNMTAELRSIHELERKAFIEKRYKYLIPSYTP